MSKLIRLIISIGLTILPLLLSGCLAHEGQPASDKEEQDLPPIELPEKGNSKLDSQLNQLVIAKAQNQADFFAQQSNIELVNESVRVIIECLPGQLAAATEAATAIGASVEASYENLLQVVVPVTSLTALVESSAIHLVRLPYHTVPTVTSEGVALVNADDWQAAGYNGMGVKVAILDGGFSGYLTRQGEGELPAVTPWWAPSIGDEGTSIHGTGCAEIIYDVAPGASLYFANYGTTVEKGNAVNWFVSQGVDIISCSMGSFYGPGDGTGTQCAIVDTARDAGILWSQAITLPSVTGRETF
ncbi:hypothetical protein ES708_28472 [subsurface metagenome]